MNASQRARLFIGMVPAGLALLALVAPFLWREHALAAWAVTQFFSVVCHQDPGRSFWLAGAPVAVCARCLGIYLGAAAGAWLRMPHARTLRLVLVVAGLNAIDVLAEIAGFHGSWTAARFVLGGALGVAIGALVVSALPGLPAMSRKPA
jgi:uncharacterized membrane protein